jgi:serine O-acetyltransferase
MNLISFYRLQRWLYVHKVPLLPKIIQFFIFLLFNSKVTPDSKIGKGTYCVCRGISTVLIPGTEVGNNCVLGLRFSTVRKFPYKDVPKIGNNVWCGPNVIIAGPVVIEDNVIIAGNSFVDKSVPEGAIVAGTPARIIGWVKDLNYNIFDNPKNIDGIMPYLEDKCK